MKFMRLWDGENVVFLNPDHVYAVSDSLEDGFTFQVVMTDGARFNTHSVEIVEIREF